jgi:hypothetical protein
MKTENVTVRRSCDVLARVQTPKKVVLEDELDIIVSFQRFALNSLEIGRHFLRPLMRTLRPQRILSLESSKRNTSIARLVRRKN